MATVAYWRSAEIGGTGSLGHGLVPTMAQMGARGRHANNDAAKRCIGSRDAKRCTVWLFIESSDIIIPVYAVVRA